jgi:hypothetical protein
MKPAIFSALLLFSVVNASDACAWTYVLVDSHGHESISSVPPRDLTFPPDNVRIPPLDVARGTPPQGTRLSAEQERLRMNQDMLIITDAAVTTSTDKVSAVK